MNFGAERSRFAHLLMVLKMFGIKTKQCRILCSTLTGRSLALRTVDSSGITSSVSIRLFPPPSPGHCTSLALLWGPLPPSLWFWGASEAQVSPQPVAQGQGRAEGMVPCEQGICLQLVCPSAAAPALSRWAPTAGALQEQEGIGTWRVMRSAECWMQMCGWQLEIREGM